MDTIKPSTFVCSVSDDKIARAGDNELLLPIFVRRMTNEVSKNRCPRCNVPLVEIPYEGTFTLHCSFCNGNLMEYSISERIITRKDKVFSEDEIKNAKTWRNLQKVNIPAIDSFPNIRCPICNTQMAMVFHSILTGVIVDRCLNKNCRAVWCDDGELEKIQILVEDAEKTAAVK